MRDDADPAVHAPVPAESAARKQTGESIRARLAASEQSAERFRILSRMQNAIAREHSLDDMLGVVTESAVSLVGLDGAVVLLLNPDGRTLTPKSPVGIREDAIPGEILTATGGIVRKALDTRRPVVFEDAGGGVPVPVISNGRPAGAVLVMPVYLGDESLGVLLAYFAEPHAFTDVEAASITVFADSVAVAVVHARTYAESVREKNRLDAVLETIPSGAMIIERPDARIALANQRLKEFLGQDIPLGSTLGELARETHFRKPGGTEILPDDLPIMRAMLLGERSDGEETTIILPDGSTVTTLANAAPLRDEEGRIYGAVGEFEDVSDMKRAQDMLSQALDKERRISATLQQALLPSIPDRIDGLLIAGGYRPAFYEDYVGGDFYDIFCPAPGLVALVIGDVSGKGINGAVRTALTKYTLRAYAHEDPSPASVMSRLNDSLCQELEHESFVTVFYGLLRLDDHVLSFSNAGHEPPLHFSGVCREVTELRNGGTPLGVLPDQAYTERTTRMEDGDRLLFYTDGVTDARNKEGFLGTDGLKQVFVERAQELPAEFVQNLLLFLQDFSEGLLRDDVALLLVCTE